MTRRPLLATAASIALALLVSRAAADPVPPSSAEGKLRGESERGRFYLEAALAPYLNQQQIEGPSRDDLLVNDVGFTSLIDFTYAPIPWLEPGILLQFDAGGTRHAQFTRPDAAGETTESQLVEGSFFELWVTLLLRGRFGPMFAELGWAPLILRNDTTRTDLPNVAGETDGVFVGSRAVAWMLAVGGAIPVRRDLDVTLRLQFRIRYLVSRGGEDLAGDEELGNMFVSPSIGVGYRF
jgi:hypothetical protein